MNPYLRTTSDCDWTSLTCASANHIIVVISVTQVPQIISHFSIAWIDGHLRHQREISLADGLRVVMPSHQ